MATNSTILLVISISCLCSTRDVYIQPSEGEPCPGTCYNITTFGKMADSFSNSFGLVVYFLEGTHLLDLQELVVFMNLTNTVFEGIERMVLLVAMLADFKCEVKIVQIFYHSQMLGYEDCIYRYQGTYDYVMATDVDIFYVLLLPGEPFIQEINDQAKRVGKAVSHLSKSGDIVTSTRTGLTFRRLNVDISC